jgi:hypothetical protein
LRYSTQHPFGGLLGSLTVTGDGELVGADPVDGVVATFPHELKQEAVGVGDCVELLEEFRPLQKLSLLLIDCQVKGL